MVCARCREDDHEHCDDTQHPQQDYRGCGCQHERRTVPDDDKDQA